MSRLISRFKANQRGSVAIAFGLAAVPILGVMGVAVDYGRASHFRSELQSAVDAAALAGATNVADNKVRKTVDAYMNASLPGGTSTYHVHYALDLKSDAVTVSATAIVPATIAGFLKPELPVSASATASRGVPVRSVQISVSDFNADAWDANSIYWYIIPKGGGLPADSDLHLLLSNDPAHPASTVASTIQMAVADEIGFALVNVTGGVHPYGKNSYGQPQGSVHSFYSQQKPENLHSAGYEDCKAGSVQHAWDDNGGGSDDNDYNDAVYTFSCASVQTDPKTIVLIR